MIDYLLFNFIDVTNNSLRKGEYNANLQQTSTRPYTKRNHQNR